MYTNMLYAPAENFNRQHPVKNLKINTRELQYYNTDEVEHKYKRKHSIPIVTWNLKEKKQSCRLQ